MSAHTPGPDIKTLRNALSAMHAVACGDSTRPYMSIPADPKRDADLLLSGALDELEHLRAERDDLLAALRRAAEYLDRCACAKIDGAEAEADALYAAIASVEGVKP